jgi:hypothetical protein
MAARLSTAAATIGVRRSQRLSRATAATAGAARGFMGWGPAALSPVPFATHSSSAGRAAGASRVAPSTGPRAHPRHRPANRHPGFRVRAVLRGSATASGAEEGDNEFAGEAGEGGAAKKGR